MQVQKKKRLKLWNDNDETNENDNIYYTAIFQGIKKGLLKRSSFFIDKIFVKGQNFKN